LFPCRYQARNSMAAPSELVGGTVQSLYISMINKCLVE
jgi:hypothetical protein